MKLCTLTMLFALAVIPALSAAQTGQSAARGSGSASASAEDQTAATKAVAAKIADSEATRFVRALTNVQIEVTLTDQIGANAPGKKTVSMIVSSGNWGKIRSAANVLQPGEQPYVVELNVDARPFVAVDGPIQVELTLEYRPPNLPQDAKDPKPRPTGINQSQTVVMQSGKPLIIAQAADPLSDRKVIVELKATVLK